MHEKWVLIFKLFFSNESKTAALFNRLATVFNKNLEGSEMKCHMCSTNHIRNMPTPTSIGAVRGCHCDKKDESESAPPAPEIAHIKFAW